MAMFLTLLCVSLLAVAVLAVIVTGAAPRGQRPDLRSGTGPALEPPRFFGGDTVQPPAGPSLPVELVIAQLERQIRLERAAAESSLDLPVPDPRHPSANARLVN